MEGIDITNWEEKFICKVIYSTDVQDLLDQLQNDCNFVSVQSVTPLTTKVLIILKVTRERELKKV